MSNEEILKRLRNDDDYYGEFGKKWMSNSSLGILFDNPRMFGVPEEDSMPLLYGKYFHTSVLEPEKLKDFQIVDASTRNTNIYKDAVKEAGTMLLLKKEADEIKECVDAIKDNDLVNKIVYMKGNQFEVPAIGEILGVPFKGKADILNSRRIYDLKTTQDINKFKWKAFEYNYDSQAYIYSTLFGVQMSFIVVDKATKQLGIFDCSDQFLLAGRKKVAKALDIWNKFFGPEATEDVKQYVIEYEL